MSYQHDEPRKRFDEMSRVEIAESIHIISAKLRAARADLQAARGLGRDEVARIRHRIQKLSTAVSAAQLELTRRNERFQQAQAFVYAARERLPADVFNQINEAARAAA